MLKKSLLSKILLTVIAINILGFSALIYKVIKAEEKNTLIEKAKSSELMAKPILHALYQNMLDQRADMARYLIDGTKAIEGVERVQVVRANGREEAFQDLKTIKKVEATLGTQNPDWRVNHPDNKDNVAKGVDDPRFIKFLEESLSNKLTDSTYYTEIVNGHRMQTYLMPIIKRDACNVCHQGLDGNGILMITSNIEDVYDTIAWNTKKWLFFGLVTIVLISLILTLLVRRIVTAPIGDTRDMLQEIAQGRGDLTKRLSVKSEDEVGTLSLWFNRFMEGMQDMIKEVVSTATRVLMSSASIKESTNGIKNAVQAQIFAVEETHNSITKMDGSIKDVSANAENLLVVAENASASTLELSATISDVAESVQHLSLSVGDTASAINEIAASLHQVSTHIDTLYNESESVASTSTEMDSTIKEVSMHTREQAELADKVKANASTIGIAAVDKTIKGIENIRSHVNQTSEVIDRLGERSSDIGHIVGVIDEVAETTNLLALNATILAAQAGKHGKGFAVVAEEVKGLADRTSASTREIDELIKLVQQEVKVATDSMKNCLESVDDGITLSNDASNALSKIIDSADDSLNMARKVEHATDEQSKSISMMTKSIQRISGMVEEIKKATDEQTRASGGITHATENMQDITIQVEKATSEQSKEVRVISEVITSVAEKMQLISDSTHAQKVSSESIIKAIEIIRTKTDENAQRAEDLDRTVQALEGDAESLKDKTDNFKV